MKLLYQKNSQLLIQFILAEYFNENRCLEKLKNYASHLEDEPLKKAASFKEFGSALLKLLKATHADENLLYFLLRHHQTMDKFFGKKTTRSLVESRSEEMKQAYKKRHFTALITQIDQHLAKL